MTEKMTEKKFNASMDYIFKLFENIQLSDIEVKRTTEEFSKCCISDYLDITIKGYLSNTVMQIGYQHTDTCKQVYVMVNGLTTCSIKNYTSDIKLKDFYKICENSLMETFKELERWN